MRGPMLRGVLRLRETCRNVSFTSFRCAGVMASSSTEHPRAWLNARLLVLEEAAARWRKEVGQLSCRYLGVGPSGGFCLDPKKKLSGDAGCLPKGLAMQLGVLFSNSSVLDFGAGAGMYGRYFARHAPSVRWVGVDGAEGVEEATEGHVRFAELTDPLPSWIRALGVSPPPSSAAHTNMQAASSSATTSSFMASSFMAPSWDYVMSLEVGEHVAREREAYFVHNLASSARRGIVLSWARLGQGGTDHVNCQSTAAIACAMRLLGWQRDAPTQQRLRAMIGRHAHDCGWLRTSLQVFRPTPCPTPPPPKSGGAVTSSSGRHGAPLCPLPAAATREFVASYLEATRASCPYVRDGCNTTRFKYDWGREAQAMTMTRDDTVERAS